MLIFVQRIHRWRGFQRKDLGADGFSGFFTFIRSIAGSDYGTTSVKAEINSVKAEMN